MAHKTRRRGKQEEEKEEEANEVTPRLTTLTLSTEKLDLLERKMQALLLPSFDKNNSSAPDEEAAEAVGYLVSTLASELEAGQLHSPEDVFGVVQAFLPEEMLMHIAVCVEDEDDMEVFISKIWAFLVKENLVCDPDAEGEEVRGFDEEDGCCEMCTRAMPLTRHHLRPRSTHKKFLKQGLSQDVLNICAAICRPCHSALHRTHDNDTLGKFYTVDLLLADEKIARFVTWVKKQRPRTGGHNQQLRYRR